MAAFRNGEGLDSVLEGFTLCNGSGSLCVYFNAGGAVFCSDSSPTIRGNIISGNSAANGGAIFCFESSNPSIEDNLITGNDVSSNGGGISSLCWYGSSSPTISNTILYGDTAPGGPEMMLLEGTGSPTPSTADLSHCDTEGGQAAIYVGWSYTLNWGPGMLAIDPLFAEAAAGDLHLTFSSPCRDADDNTSLPLGLIEDFESDPRTAGGIVDIGADEFHAHLYAMGDFVPGGLIDVRITGHDAGHPGTRKRHPGSAPNHPVRRALPADAALLADRSRRDSVLRGSRAEQKPPSLVDSRRGPPLSSPARTAGPRLAADQFDGDHGGVSGVI